MLAPECRGCLCRKDIDTEASELIEESFMIAHRGRRRTRQDLVDGDHRYRAPGGILAKKGFGLIDAVERIDENGRVEEKAHDSPHPAHVLGRIAPGPCSRDPFEDLLERRLRVLVRSTPPPLHPEVADRLPH